MSLPISLLSMMASVYAAVRIRDVRRKLVLNLRAEEVLDDLERTVDSINQNLSELPSKRRDLEGSMSLLVAKMIRISPSLSPDLRAIARKMFRLHQEYAKSRQYHVSTDNSSAELEMLWSLFFESRIFVDHLRDMIADRRIGGSHDL